MSIPVVDLFAGPGGLGEGFSSFVAPEGHQAFRLALSIEVDPFAHQTLELRSFFRKFAPGEAPDEYYAYCRGEISKAQLFGYFPILAGMAREEAWHAQLGGVPEPLLDQRIKTAIGSGKAWVLIGGPPCQAYSTAGRSRMRSADPSAFEADGRHFLYEEYLRIIRRFSPPVFVMENVKGLLSSTVRGEAIFRRILRDLSEPAGALGPRYRVRSMIRDKRGSDYDPEDYIIPFERYGIPQRRHRVILLGIRADLDQGFRLLSETSSSPTVADAIGDLPPIRSKLSRQRDTFEAWQQAVRATAEIDLGLHSEDPAFMKRLHNAIRDARHSGIGHERYFLPSGQSKRKASKWLSGHEAWFADPNLESGVLNHVARAHMAEDLAKYLFLAVLAELRGESPKLRDFPRALLPKHRNVDRALRSDNFADRFRVQVFGQPATTIMSHIAKDGHYYVHPDPSQCRSLTVREAARLQTFPDNYLFEGPRTQQYRQVGNAVPPLVARQIAESVFKIVRHL